MDDEPEKIWATPMDEECPRGTYVSTDLCPEQPNNDATEYIRTDLLEAAIAAAEKRGGEKAMERFERKVQHILISVAMKYGKKSEPLLQDLVDAIRKAMEKAE